MGLESAEGGPIVYFERVDATDPDGTTTRMLAMGERSQSYEHVIPGAATAEGSGKESETLLTVQLDLAAVEVAKVTLDVRVRPLGVGESKAAGSGGEGRGSKDEPWGVQDLMRTGEENGRVRLRLETVLDEVGVCVRVRACVLRMFGRVLTCSCASGSVDWLLSKHQ